MINYQLEKAWKLHLNKFMFKITSYGTCFVFKKLNKTIKVPARVPRKPISANLGLNLANRGIHFVPRLDYVPESMINLNLGIN